MTSSGFLTLTILTLVSYILEFYGHIDTVANSHSRLFESTPPPNKVGSEYARGKMAVERKLSVVRKKKLLLGVYSAL